MAGKGWTIHVELDAYEYAIIMTALKNAIESQEEEERLEYRKHDITEDGLRSIFNAKQLMEKLRRCWK